MTSNPAHALDAAMSFSLPIRRHRRGASDVHCWAVTRAMILCALAILALLSLASCATAPTEQGRVDGRLHQSAKLTAASLRNVHEQLLRARDDLPWLADYAPQCYTAKGYALLYGTETGPVCVRLQLFTHGSVPQPPDTYGVFIEDTNRRFDIAGTIQGESTKVRFIVGLLAETVRQDSP